MSKSRIWQVSGRYLRTKRKRKLTFENLESRRLLTAEAEPNDTVANATALQANASIEGTIATLADVDYFKISLTQGARLRLFDINLAAPLAPVPLPPSIEVLDQSGNVLAASAVGDFVEATANTPGVYFIRVTSKSAFGSIADSYSFKSSVTNFAGTLEQEPNDARASANALGVNGAFQGELSASDASDLYSFHLNSEDSVFINFNGLPDQRPGARLLDSSGAVLDVGLAGEGISFNATTAGTYYLEVIDNSSAGQTQFYVGVNQVGSKADKPADLGDNLDHSSVWTLKGGDSTASGELTTLADIDTFAITLTSLDRVEINLRVAGSENIPTYGRSMIAYDRRGVIVAKSRNGVLNIERYLGSTPGEFFIQVLADSQLGLGKYGLRSWIFNDFSNQRDVPLHLVDFTQQFPEYLDINFDAPFAAKEAIPFVTGLLQSRYGGYDVDITLTKPDIPLDQYIRSGFGDFHDIGGGLGGGYYGTRRPNGETMNNADQKTWTLADGAGALIHEFGHAAGLGHARDISSLMSYQHTDNIFQVGDRYGFVDLDQRRPDQGLTNDRNRLDWNLGSGSQVEERESDLNSPQEIDSNFLEMTFELNASTKTYSTQQNPNHSAFGDLNGDGWKDIVVSHSGTGLSVYMSDTHGGFLSPRDYTVDTMGWWTESVTVADFNGDGKDDVAVISWEKETLTILTAGVDGALTAGTKQAIGRWPSAITSGDMDGDGIVDLVATNSNNQVTILRGAGNGTFQPPLSIDSGTDPNHLVLADFNGDNRVDIATANYGSNSISIILANSSGGYNAATTLLAGARPKGLTSGDFDGDGDIDLATADLSLRQLTIYTNRGNGLFDATSSGQIGITAENLTTADMNQDGRPDIIASGFAGKIEVLLGLGNGEFSRGVSFSTPYGSINSLVLDIDRDGRLDVASISYWQNQLYVQTGTSNNLRNDRVVVYGKISSAQDVDVYSMKVAAGEEYAFDIDAAEFQYPLDAELKILSSNGSVLGSNKQAVDRESGIDSVDPYLVTKFSISETIRIVVASEFGTAGGYRLKVTPSTALKAQSPRVLAVVPDNGAVVDSTRQISFLMDKPIDPASIHSGSILVRGATSGLRTGSAFFNPLDGFLVWTADTVLPIDTYTMTLVSGPTGIRDMFGNDLDGEIASDFKFPNVSGNSAPGGDFVTGFSIDRLDTTVPFLYYAAYQRDASNRGRFEFRWNDDLSFASVENADFTLRGAGPDGQFNTADDRIQILDAVYDKIQNLSYGQSLIDLYSRGYPDSDLYRIEATLTDVAGNAVSISERIDVGSTVPASALFVDSGGTSSGLTGSYVNGSLRSTTSQADWRTTQTIAGTRIDSSIAFNTNSLGRRADVNITGGTDEDWDDFSTQWDGWITIPRNGMRLQTLSANGSRMWVDINANGQFESSELFDNHWGSEQAVTAGALTPALAAGTFQIRIQYEVGSYGNGMMLEWIEPDAPTDQRGHTNGPSVIGLNIQPGSAYNGDGVKVVEVDFSGAIDLTSLNTSNFRLRYSANPDFFDGDDLFLQDADGEIKWQPTLHRATFETAEVLKPGYYLVELNGKAGGIQNLAGQLLDGEFLANFIAGNTNLGSQPRSVSGNGIPGGDYRAGFSFVAQLSVTLASSSISENGGTTVGSVTRNVPTTADLVVNLSGADPNAVTMPATVTIPAGTSTATFTIVAIDNSVAGGDQTLNISASTTGLASASAPLTILDDETASLALTFSPSSISENGGATTGSVVRNTPTASALVVSLSSSDPATATIPATVTIPAGSSFATFTIAAVDNSVADGNQTLNISASTTGLASASASLTIADDETASLTLTLSPSSISEKGGTATGRVTRNTPTATPLVVNLSSSDPTAVAIPTTVTIAAGSSFATFTIAAVDDSMADGNQTLHISASATGLASASAMLTIVDDDTSSLALTLSPSSISENGGTTTGRVTRNSPTATALVVNLIGSAPVAVTFPATVTIPAGASFATFDIVAVDNSVAGGNQTLNIIASAAGLASASAPLTIVDDEISSLTLTLSPSSISENGGVATGKVTRNTPTAAALVVSLSSSDPAAATFPASVTIPAGASFATFTIAAVDDSVAGGNQTLNISASATDLASASASLTIVDDETASLALTFNPSSISENGGISTGRVTRNTSTATALVVNLSSSAPAVATVPATVTIPAGASFATFTVAAVDDAVATGNQILDIFVSGTGFASNSASLTIVDDDTSSLALTLSPSSISENGGTATGRITRNTPTTSALVVALSSSDRSAATVPATVTIPAGSSFATFAITAVDDMLVDGTQLTTITSTASGHALAEATLAVTDDELGSVWKNQSNPLDVNNDGFISTIDALLIINDINTFGARSLLNSPPKVSSPRQFIDVNGDYQSTPIDVLLVINYLNAEAIKNRKDLGEGEAADDRHAAVDHAMSDAAWLMDTSVRKRLGVTEEVRRSQ